jgi:hypothetical protein
MNAMVTTVSGSGQEWTPADRLGRKGGPFTHFSECEFLISAEGISTSGPLAKMDEASTSLATALDTIAGHMRGACRFAKEEDA